MRSRRWVVVAGLMAAGGGMAAGHDRPSGPKDQTRSSVIARHGMAATSHPLATETPGWPGRSACRARGSAARGWSRGVGPEARTRLESLGHRLVAAPGSFGGYQAIRFDEARGGPMGGSDPRKDGAAAGY